MSKNAIQSALQIVAVVSVLVGLTMTSSAMVVTVGYSRTVAQMKIGGASAFSSANPNQLGLGVLSAAMPLLWGAILYLVSPKIAAHIHGGQSPTSPGNRKRAYGGEE